MNAELNKIKKQSMKEIERQRERERGERERERGQRETHKTLSCVNGSSNSTMSFEKNRITKKN